MSETLTDRMAKLTKLTTSMNNKARKKNPDGPVVAFIAAGNEALMDKGVLPVGNPTVDRLLDGGLPRGNTAMFWGPPGTGKTRLALDVIAHNQRVNPEFIALWVQLEEQNFPIVPALETGIDLSRLMIIPAHASAEATFDKMIEFVFDWDTNSPTNLIDLVVIDSIAAAVPEAELKAIREEGFSKDTVGRPAAMLSKFFRAVSGCGCLHNTSLLLINQVRVNIGGYGSPQTMPGGEATKHIAKIILKLTKSELVKQKDKVIGHKVKVQVAKNNSGRGFPMQEDEYEVIYGQGVSIIGPLLDYACELGIVQAGAGGMFRWDWGAGPQSMRGRDNMVEMIRENPAFLAELRRRVETPAEQQTDAEDAADTEDVRLAREEIAGGETVSWETVQADLEGEEELAS